MDNSNNDEMYWLRQLEDPNEHIRYLALEELVKIYIGRINYAFARSKQEKYLRTNSHIRVSIATNIIEGNVSYILNMLSEDNKWLRAGIINEMNNLMPRTIQTFITNLGNHPDPSVRGAIASILGGFKANDIVQGLIAALQDENSGVRANAAASLGTLRLEYALDPLTKALDDPSDEVVECVIRGLGEIGHKSSLVDLMKIFYKTSNDKLKRAIIESLVHFEGDETINIMYDIITKYESVEIKETAILSLMYFDQAGLETLRLGLLLGDEATKTSIRNVAEAINIEL